MTTPRHPSRDEFYRRGDTEPNGQMVLVDQQEDPARNAMAGFNYSSTPDPAKFDPSTNTSRLRPVAAQNKHSYAAAAMASLADSRVPTTHLSREMGDVELDIQPTQFGGFFMESKTNLGKKHEIILPSRSASTRHDTVVHELGHAYHYATTPDKYRRTGKRYPVADPSMEGIADGYADRYAGPLSDQVKEAKAGRAAGSQFGHIQNTGYSTHYEDGQGANAQWDAADRALYAGTRAHFDATGQVPQVQKSQVPGVDRRGFRAGEYGRRGHPSVDATINYLAQSPHAQQAWKDTTTTANPGLSQSLESVANEAIRRHKDRRIMNEGQFTQMSMLEEIRAMEGPKTGKVLGYVPSDRVMPGKEPFKMADEMGARHGSKWVEGINMETNQFGEAPRTAKDIQNSLDLRDAPYGRKDLYYGY